MKVNALAKIGAKVSRVAGKTGLKIRAKSPEILLAAGVVGFVGTVVLACKATLKIDETLAVAEAKKNEIEKGVVDELRDYTEEDAEADMKILKAKTAVQFIKLYAPTIALGGVSVACLLTSTNILNKRYLAAVSAYNAVSELFQQYRKRVVDEYGDKLDRHFRYGAAYDTITDTTVDENGKKVKTKVDTESIDKDAISNYDTARFFEEGNKNWDRSSNYNHMFLRGQQNIANNILHSRGYIFLNEVYEMLGFQTTTEGHHLGWIDDGTGSGYVDFGLFDQGNDGVRRFINGQTASVMLDFNVDGIIWDRVWKKDK